MNINQVEKKKTRTEEKSCFGDSTMEALLVLKSQSKSSIVKNYDDSCKYNWPNNSQTMADYTTLR